VLSLREAIAHNYQRFYGISFNPADEVVVTNGATEAIYCTIAGLVNPGDEVVVLEPFYDSYLAALQIAGAVVVPVTLKTPHFSFDRDELTSAVSSKTKMLILNNPHNPSGKMFTKEEIDFIATLANLHDFYVLSDEVYEFLTFEKNICLLLALIASKHERLRFLLPEKLLV